MHGHIRHQMRNTKQRSVWNALAMLLLVLRFGIPQRFLAILFRTTQPVVSEAINRAKDLLLERFVPTSLGFSHLSREAALGHNSELINIMFEGLTKLKIIIDGMTLTSDCAM